MYIGSVWVDYGGTIGVIFVLATIIPGFAKGVIHSGLHGFNGVLSGVLLFLFLGDVWSNRVIISIIVVSAISSVLLAALLEVFAVWDVLSYTLPFNFIKLIFLCAIK